MAESEYVLTQAGKKQLEEELAYLEGDKRAEVGERIRVAREFGDISENSEYDDAKNEQAMVETRIAEINRTTGAVASVPSPSWAAPKATSTRARFRTRARSAPRCSATRRAMRWKPPVRLAARSR